MQSAAGPRDPDRGLLVRPAMRDGQFPSMFVCPACGLRLTATLQEGSATAVRCECQKEFVVKLPLARKNTRQHRLPFQSNDSSSSETESCARARGRRRGCSLSERASMGQRPIAGCRCPPPAGTLPSNL
eukprot:scaffold3836_cov125-Isochrysis_galbana.AAC.12